MKLPKYWVVILAMIFSIGPNLLIMSGFMQIQAIIQNSFGSSSYSTMDISIISNIAFAVFIPLGPVLSRKFGIRLSFYSSQVISALTFIISAISSNTFVLAFSRSIEGALTGTQLMVLVPLLFIEYPAEREIVYSASFYRSYLVQFRLVPSSGLFHRSMIRGVGYLSHALYLPSLQS